jgi:hypothetical protein
MAVVASWGRRVWGLDEFHYVFAKAV